MGNDIKYTFFHEVQRIVKKDVSGKKEEETIDSINSFVSERQITLLQIFPVAVRAMNGKSEDVVAFLDDGSTGTLITYPSLSVLKSAKNTKTTSTEEVMGVIDVPWIEFYRLRG